MPTRRALRSLRLCLDPWEVSLTLNVTTGKFRQSVMRKLQKNYSPSSLGRRTHFLSQQVLRVGPTSFADVMPQCGEDGRRGEGLKNSTGLQKTSPSHFSEAPPIHRRSFFLL